MITFSIAVTFFFAAFYVWLFGNYLTGWKRIPEFVPGPVSAASADRITVIIAARNEEQHISASIRHIRRQTLPAHLFEVIYVNDHSEDGTLALLEKELAGEEHLHFISLTDTCSKKQAISAALRIAKGNIIVTTDADCVFESEWLATVYAFYQQHDAMLVSAPVSFIPRAGFWQGWQYLEFSGLIGIGGASIRNRNPNMCNGANLSYRKQVFEEVNGYRDNLHLLSGDDEFLMHKVFAQYPEKVFFLKSRKAIVQTPAHRKLSDFVQQRMRWASKSGHYTNKKITVTLMGAYFFNLWLFVLLVSSFINSRYLPLFAGLFFVKTILEYLFFHSVLEFFQRKKLLFYVIPAELFHVIYVLLIGVLGSFVPYRWKGRTSSPATGNAQAIAR